MQTNFEIDQAIAISSGEHYLDLHNNFAFVGIDYQPTAMSAVLRWTRGAGSWVPADAPREVILTFRRVTNFAVCRRDDAMPRTEDRCLETVSFTPPEFGDDFDRCFQGYRSQEEHLTLRFHSGAAIKIWADVGEFSIH